MEVGTSSHPLALSCPSQPEPDTEKPTFPPCPQHRTALHLAIADSSRPQPQTERGDKGQGADTVCGQEALQQSPEPDRDTGSQGEGVLHLPAALCGAGSWAGQMTLAGNGSHAPFPSAQMVSSILSGGCQSIHLVLTLSPTPLEKIIIQLDLSHRQVPIAAEMPSLLPARAKPLGTHLSWF